MAQVVYNTRSATELEGFGYEKLEDGLALAELLAKEAQVGNIKTLDQMKVFVKEWRNIPKTGNGNDVPPPTPQDSIHPTEPQLKRLWAIAGVNKWTKEQVHALIKKTWGLDSTGILSIAQYNELCGDQKKGIAGLLTMANPSNGEIPF